MENIIKLNNNEYILADTLIAKAPIYSKGARSTRELVKKKHLHETLYIYARQATNGKWTVTDGKSVKYDKVLISTSLLEKIPELNPEEKVVDDAGIEKAPPLIYLAEHEKFQDDSGIALEIETRGERSHDKIYFKVNDVAEGFDLENIYTTIIKNHTSYELHRDYEYFICENNAIVQTGTSKMTTKKDLFLTYQGMLRVLFVSRNNKTSQFIGWATKTLFATHMGTVEQKDQLVSKVKGVSYEAIQELFAINARQIPCVYLTSFNQVSKLRAAMNIDTKYADDDVVYKFGLTKSFESRKYGHKSEYKKIEDLIDMRLVYFTYVDPLYISEAENEIKDLLDDYRIEWEGKKELVVIPNKLMKLIKEVYEKVGMKYAGHSQELIKKISDLEAYTRQLEKDLVHQKELLVERLRNKDLVIETKVLTIETKDLVIENLRKDLKIKELELALKK
jgi:hypothetical protein